MLTLWEEIERKAKEELRSEIALALDTTTGGALSPESLEPKVVELVKYLAPFAGMLYVTQANGKTHDFNRRTALPSGGFEGEKAVTATSQSTYSRVSTPLKIIRARGGVTGFQQAASKKFIDSYADEIMGAARTVAWTMEYGVCWGDAVADPYQYTGLDKSIVTNRVDKNAVISLLHLDDLIDRLRNKGIVPVQSKDLLFLMSPGMKSKISNLATETRRTLTKIQFEGGQEMDAYRDVPIKETSFTRPSSTMGVVIAADDATVGGLIAVTTYKYKVAAVTLFGEQWASPEVSHATGGGITSIALSWTAVSGALLYKIYRTAGGGAADSEVLDVVIAARTYDGDGTVTGNVTSYVDVTADAARLGTDVPLSAVNADEVIFLANRDRSDSLEIASLLNEQGEKVENLIQMLPLARIKDAEEFLLLSYQALIYKGDIFNGMLRRVRVA